ncbi:MAG: aldo/keto reductase [Hyphomicrobiales bacterium]
MHKRKLGNNGPEVSAIGVGCWSFAGAYGPTDEAESHATLARALDVGIDFLDTADVYGMGISEKAIGSFIKDKPGAFKIATKAAIRREPETNERVFDNSEEHLRARLEMSLRNLGLDYVDLFYVHRFEQERPVEDVMETLLKFKQEGKIGGIGFSEIAPSTLKRAQAIHPVMAVQSEYSLWTRQPDLGMIRACKDHGVAFVAFSPLGRGVFTESKLDPAEFPDSDFRKKNPRFVEPNFSYNVQAIAPFKAFAHEKDVSSSQLALAWVLHQGEHMFAIPGTRSPRHLSEDAEAADIILSQRDLARIDEILPIGFAHGDRYTEAQWPGAQRYC